MYFTSCYVLTHCNRKGGGGNGPDQDLEPFSQVLYQLSYLANGDLTQLSATPMIYFAIKFVLSRFKLSNIELTPL